VGIVGEMGYAREVEGGYYCGVVMLRLGRVVVHTEGGEWHSSTGGFALVTELSA